MALAKSGSLEAMFLGVNFPFDQASPEATRLRRMLFSGVSAALSPTDIPDGDGGKARPEVVVAFFVVSGAEYRQEMRARHGEHLTEITGESVFHIGVPSRAMERIKEALAADLSVYLIPEEADGVFGRYTLCVIDTPSPE